MMNGSGKFSSEDVVFLALVAIGAVFTIVSALAGVWLPAYLVGSVTTTFAVHEIRRLRGHRRPPVVGGSVGDRLLTHIELTSPASNVAGFMFIVGAIFVFALDEGYYPVAWLCVPILLTQATVLVVLIRRKDQPRD